MKRTVVLLVAVIAGASSLTSCKNKGCTDPTATNYDMEASKDDGSCTYNTSTVLSFNFTHNWDGQAIDAGDFNQFNYVNLNGDTLSLTKLRYLISDIRLYKSNGDSIVLEGYQLVDLTNSTGLTYSPGVTVPNGSYTGLSFIFGFDSLDNVDNAYPDLNSVSWNWPSMLGGGYHFMQMEGKYKVMGNDSLYAYHQGMARVSPGVFEQNYFKADLTGVNLTEENASVEIQMNVAEWYKNPHTWDLSVYNTMLMPNYTAQKMMQDNGASVFSLGTVTQ